MTAAQTSFVPIHCTRTKAPPASADADCIAYCDNTGQPYLCKSTLDLDVLPATEWICSHLARDCGLPVPPFQVIKIKGRDDSLFGSEWLGGGQGYAVALPNVRNGYVFSKTLAFDFAAHNVDRHINNYLYLDLAGEIVVKIIDFSRAWTFHGWPMPPLPMSAKENTPNTIRTWSAVHPFRLNDAEEILKKWDELPSTYLETVLNSMPSEWLDQDMREKLIQWWISPSRQIRAMQARKCLP